jgi:hypothetical protein
VLRIPSAVCLIQGEVRSAEDVTGSGHTSRIPAGFSAAIAVLD